LITGTYEKIVQPTLSAIFLNIENDFQASLNNTHPILFSQCLKFVVVFRNF